jgi:hypothetical protein
MSGFLRVLDPCFMAQTKRRFLQTPGSNRIGCRQMHDVTKLLGAAADGDPDALNRIYEGVYSELRAIAAKK